MLKPVKLSWTKNTFFLPVINCNLLQSGIYFHLTSFQFGLCISRTLKQALISVVIFYKHVI